MGRRCRFADNVGVPLLKYQLFTFFHHMHQKGSYIRCESNPRTALWKAEALLPIFSCFHYRFIQLQAMEKVSYLTKTRGYWRVHGCLPWPGLHATSDMVIRSDIAYSNTSTLHQVVLWNPGAEYVKELYARIASTMAFECRYWILTVGTVLNCCAY